MTPAPTPQHDHGAAGFCTDHAQPAPDERVETVARVLRGRVDGACRSLMGGDGRFRGDLRTIVDTITAAVVAALDDESARLRYVENDLAYAREAGESYRRQRDAARAEVERMRAGREIEQNGLRYAAGVVAHLTAERDKARAVLAALREAFGVLIDMAEMDADGFRTVLTPADIRAVLDASEDLRAALDPKEPR